jgi:hypothetical protein
MFDYARQGLIRIFAIDAQGEPSEEAHDLKKNKMDSADGFIIRIERLCRHRSCLCFRQKLHTG